jgi:CIC family chloride channel protein
VSLFIASRLQHEPIYEALAVQDGIHLPTAESRQRYGQRQVMSVMRPPSDPLPSEITVRETMDRVGSTKVQTWLVADGRGLIGVISRAQLAEQLQSDADKNLEDLLDPITFPHVHVDQGLDLALERMGINQLEILPVVNRADIHKLEGIVTLRDVLKAYGVSPRDGGEIT